MIERLCVLKAPVGGDRWELSPNRLELDVGLVHARSGYAAINFSREKTVSRDRM